MRIEKSALPYARITRERRDYAPDATRPEETVEHHVEIVDLAAFDSALIEYRAARAQHRFTVGVPAPFPTHEMFRTICEHCDRGGSLEIVHDTQIENDRQAAMMEDAFRSRPPIVRRASFWQRIKRRIGL